MPPKTEPQETPEKAGAVGQSEPCRCSFSWSKVPPTVPGWYWSRDHHGVARVEQVFVRPGHSYLAIESGDTAWGGRNFFMVSKLGREWAGPIPMPVDA